MLYIVFKLFASNLSKQSGILLFSLSAKNLRSGAFNMPAGTEWAFLVLSATA